MVENKDKEELVKLANAYAFASPADPKAFKTDKLLVDVRRQLVSKALNNKYLDTFIAENANGWLGNTGYFARALSKIVQVI